MSTHSLEGLIVTQDGAKPGRIGFGDRIETVELSDSVDRARIIAPGFIDLHVHGGGGGDCMEGEAAVRTMARFHSQHGTTSLLATTVTAPETDLRTAFDGIAQAMAEPQANASDLIGVHLEGPFINPEALGAQPPFAIPPDLALVTELHKVAKIQVATMAPEIDPDEKLLAWFKTNGVRAQIGHTKCSYAEATRALAAGAGGFTHLYNQMSGLHHRSPGTVGAALANADWAELILDFVHVEPGAVETALRAIPRLYCITDAVAAAGMPDGRYRLGRHDIIKRGNSVRLADGALAGSVLTMDQAWRNLQSLGRGYEECAARCATHAADYLGLDDRGRLAVGLRADITVLNQTGSIEQVFVAGREIEL